MDSPFRNLRGVGAPHVMPTREVSGIHEAQTEPAPYLDDEDRATEEIPLLVGSLPVSAISVDYEPVVCVESGDTVGYEVHARCSAPGLQDPADLLARALFEHHVGELGRVLRREALSGADGEALFIGVHSQELREGLLIRPDDPMAVCESPIYLQLTQSSFSAVCLQVLCELRARDNVALVIDGVGGGGSNILQIVDLAPRIVKLDPELTVWLDTDARRRAAVQHIASMCAALGCGVVGKSVSTPEELAALIDCGVSYVQGPLLGSPCVVPRPGILR